VRLNKNLEHVVSTALWLDEPAVRARGTTLSGTTNLGLFWNAVPENSFLVPSGLRIMSGFLRSRDACHSRSRKGIRRRLPHNAGGTYNRRRSRTNSCLFAVCPLYEIDGPIPE